VRGLPRHCVRKLLLQLLSVFLAGAVLAAPAARSHTPTVLRGHSDVVCSLDWSPDGKRLASASPGWEMPVALWDLRTAKRVAAIPDGYSCYGVAWRPDAKHLALAGALTMGLAICESAQPQHVTLLTKSTVTEGAKRVDELFSVAWSPDGRRLVVGGDGVVRVWDFAARKPLWTKAYGYGAVAVAWLRDGKTVAMADAVGLVMLLRASDGEVAMRLQPGGDAGTYGVYSPVACSQDGTRVAAPGFQDSTVRVWDVQTGRQLRVLTVPAYLVGSLSWSPDGKRLAGHAGDAVWIWELATGKRELALGGSMHCYSTAWRPDGKQLAIGGDDGTIRLVDVALRSRHGSRPSRGGKRE
jgi:WD40 repeat protein